MNADASNAELSLSAFRATIFWIEDILNAPVPPKGGFRSALASGEILCSLLNAILPGTIKRINRSSNRAAVNDNLSLFLLVCEKTYAIPSARLFSLEDFEDVLLMGTDESVLEEKFLKRAEKVAITLFWLAKAVSNQKRFDHLPKLDFEAFSGLLPRNLIHKSFNTGSFRGDDNLIPKLVPQSLIGQNSLELEQSVILQQQRSERLPNGVTMGSNQSVDSKENQTVSSSTDIKTTASCESQQANNNTFGQDAWQSDLDDWRAKRRQALQASTVEMTSLKQQTEEEQQRCRAAIRDRLRMIKSQRALSVTSLFPSLDTVNVPEPASPGLALLIRGTCDVWEEPFEDRESFPVVNHECNSEPMQTSKITESVPPEMSPGVKNEDKDPIVDSLPPDTIVNEQSTVELSESPVHEELPILTYPTAPLANLQDNQQLPSEREHFIRRELTFSLQSKIGANESRWGMTLKVTDPSAASPFMVDRVKLGSSADICEIRKGDILIAVNDVNLTSCQFESTTLVRTLADLENLLDRLSLENKRVSVKVQRVQDDSDFSDIDLTETSPPSVRKQDVQGSDGGESEPDNTAFTERVIKTSIHSGSSSSSDIHKTAPKPANGSRLMPSCLPISSLEVNDPYEPEAQIPITLGPRNVDPQSSTNGLLNHDASFNGSSPPILQRLNEEVQDHQHPESQRLPRHLARKVDVTQSEPNYMSLASTVVPTESPRTDYHVIQPFPDTQATSSLEKIKADPVYPENQQVESVPIQQSPLPSPPHTSFEDAMTTKLRPNLSEPVVESTPTNELMSPRSNEQRFIHIRRTDSEKIRETNEMHLNHYQQNTTLPSPPYSYGPRSQIVIEKPNHGGGLPKYNRSSTNIRHSYSPYESMEVSPQVNTEYDLSRYSYPASSPPPAPPSPLPTPEIAHWHLSTNAERVPLDNLRQLSPNGRFTNPSMVFLSAADDPPPQPPRAPSDRQVNPRHKCAACNQELGTGDLMIIGSMSLYYHLACFVCAKCGVALSDGLSNANVRIRHGLLYCDECYPSKSVHRGSIGQKDTSKQKASKPNPDQIRSLSGRGSRLTRA